MKRSRPSSRGLAMEAARRAADIALERCLADLRSTIGADRGLVVFRLQRGGDALGLAGVDVAVDGRVQVLTPVGERLADWTALYGDLLEAVGRWTGTLCPEGLVVALEPRSADVVGYPGEHCDHWDGGPELAVEYPAPDPFAAFEEPPYPQCCAGHRVHAALEALGAPVPSVRGDFDCDDPED
ncbi:hypothetical protein TEK04_02510 [Klenkia sp. LSe6-5]|uniref:Uncharacterized protein n=1 Tax=Klenkia sesuvii TaxID=3103137 RepID=A0ABU8DP04_9ACTN